MQTGAALAASQTIKNRFKLLVKYLHAIAAVRLFVTYLRPCVSSE